jgi:hypothetical protein
MLADMVDRGMLDWTHPTRWRRVSRRGAEIAVESVEEIQIIIDNILSSEWENHSESARFLNPKGGRKPTECLQLEHPLYPIATIQGLERWIDPVTGQPSGFWVVPMPGKSDPILGDVAGAASLPLTSLSPASASTTSTETAPLAQTSAAAGE